MKIEGMLYVCDRCGEKDFFQRTKVESLSGGYEHTALYEPAAGWTCSCGKNLCPPCSKSYEKLIEAFFVMAEENDGLEHI